MHTGKQNEVLGNLAKTASFLSYTLPSARVVSVYHSTMKTSSSQSNLVLYKKDFETWEQVCRQRSG